MGRYHLIIGDKNLSSWSLRAWLLLRQFGIPFDETVIPLDQPDTRARILEYSPAARVPVLLTESDAIWESLAIIEYLAERHPDLAIWPRDPGQRAQARVLAAEMHAGFAALRDELSFFGTGRVAKPELSAEAEADIARIMDIWREMRRQNSAQGDFLFGAFCAADAMYAPVAVRFDTYGITLDPDCQVYSDAILQLPAVTEWRDGAGAEVAALG